MRLLVFSLGLWLPFLCLKQKKIIVSFLHENCIDFRKDSKSFFGEGKEAQKWLPWCQVKTKNLMELRWTASCLIARAPGSLCGIRRTCVSLTLALSILWALRTLLIIGLLSEKFLSFHLGPDHLKQKLLNIPGTQPPFARQLLINNNNITAVIIP